MEAHISYYSGEVREMVVPHIIGSLMPQSLARRSSKKCYVVVVPYDSPNTGKPLKLELAVYSSSQDARPHTVIHLWKSIIVEPKFHQSDPFFTILDESTHTIYNFLSAIEGDRQLVLLYSACKGAPKFKPSFEVLSNHPESTSGSNSRVDIIRTSTHCVGGPSHGPPPSMSISNGWADDPSPSRPAASHTTDPSAPPLPMDNVDDGPIYYPEVGMGPLDSSGPNCKTDESLCVVCLDARVEGACVPCGHMAGCMSCLSEINSKRGDCPICRAKIDQVIRLYAV